MNTGSIRDDVQRNVLVVCCQSGVYSVYPASALVLCSGSFRMTSDSEQQSLIDHLVSSDPAIDSVEIKLLISQYGSKFW